MLHLRTMKRRTFILVFTIELLVLAAVCGSLLHRYRHRELPRTVENIAGEWFLRKFQVHSLDGKEEDWTEEFPWGDRKTHLSKLFDAGGRGCIDIKYEDNRIVFAKYYHWTSDSDSLWLEHEEDDSYLLKYRIEKLTRTQFVLVELCENDYGKFEWTLTYDRSSY